MLNLGPFLWLLLLSSSPLGLNRGKLFLSFCFKSSCGIFYVSVLFFAVLIIKLIKAKMFEKTPETAKYPVKLSLKGLLSLVFFLGGIAPHLLQFVKTPVLRQHYVHHNIDIVDQDPLISLSAFVFVGELIAVLSHLVFHRIRYRLDLGGTGCLAKDKKIRHCFRDLSQIEGNDIFTFFSLYCLDDCFKNFRVPVKPGSAAAVAG